MRVRERNLLGLIFTEDERWRNHCAIAEPPQCAPGESSHEEGNMYT